MGIAAIGQICINLGICSVLLAHFFARSASHTKAIADAAKAERRYQTCVREPVLAANLAQSQIWIERHTRQRIARSTIELPEPSHSICDGATIGYRLLVIDQNATFPDWPNRSVAYAVK